MILIWDVINNSCVENSKHTYVTGFAKVVGTEMLASDTDIDPL